MVEVARALLLFALAGLAAERREETLNTLEDLMGRFGVLTLLFLLAIMQLAIRANLGPQAHFDASTGGVLLAAYVGASVIWVVMLFLRFRRPA